MHILVLDTIHGGREIGDLYAGQGHVTDVVDVYTGTTPEIAENARTWTYDLIVAPVHLDPEHPLLQNRNSPVITHHEAVRRLLGEKLPHPMIEITGARGKTTTAHALAHLLPGNGVLHTSTGTYAYPTKEFLGKRSITPASVLSAVQSANQMNGWLVAEISLGVIGSGDLAIITSAEDYTFAAGKKFAVKEKIASAQHAKRLLVADGIAGDHKKVVHIEDIARCDGMNCTVELDGLRFILTNPLFILPPYRLPLMLAAAAAMMLNVDPTPLNHFAALPGRMSISHEKDIIIVDNANTGTNIMTTVCASRYARHCAGARDLTLVIGQVEGDGAVCEGFSAYQIISAIEKVCPTNLIWVGRMPDPGSDAFRGIRHRIDAHCTTLEEGRRAAVEKTDKGSIVLAVKTWR
ncbi:MAG: coenzyme F430 synthase [Methanomicrobiales archaeon HGW-Methanomicrobiales-1]|nr:MAG: coenzyme F430 synthase [Methanomicrobiales archaeon HGW-Methanomicrobiales-1]